MTGIEIFGPVVMMSKEEVKLGLLKLTQMNDYNTMNETHLNK